MNEAVVQAPAILTFPPSVVSRADVARLVEEIEKLDNELSSAAVRARVGVATTSQPVLSEHLTDFLVQNRLQLTDGRVRSGLIQQLHQLKDTVPVIHMTFATEADPESLGQLAQWLRTSVHPQAVIAVGLQPSLIAGVYVRTPNHVHDLSLKGKLKSGHALLVKELGALGGRV